MNAVVGFAAEAGKIDADITPGRNGAGGELPFERIGFVVRETVVFKLERGVAVVVQFDPAIAGFVLVRHDLADGQLVEVLRGKYFVESSKDGIRVGGVRRRHGAEAVCTVGGTRVGNIRIKSGNFNLRNDAVERIGHEEVVAAFA